MKNKIIKILILIFCLLLFIGLITGGIILFNDQFGHNIPPLTKKEPYKVLGELNKEKISIGEPFTYTVTLYKTKGIPVKLNKFDIEKDKEKFKNLKINDIKEKHFTAKSGSIEIIKNIYFLQPTDTDEAVIPAVSVSSNKEKYHLQPIKILAESVLKNPDEMKDIHDIKPLDKFFIFNLWYVIIPLIAILILALLAYFILKHKAVFIEEVDEHEYKPPHLVAYEELSKLKKIELNTYEDYKIFYTHLSEIFRKYLEGRFNIQAMERTTEEINADLIKIKFNLKTRNLAKAILSKSDMVKFAKDLPTKEIAYSSLEKAYYFVDTTKQEYQSNFEKEE